MSFERMMKIYKNYGKSVETENMFYMMYEHGIISAKTWRRFIKETNKEN